MILRINYIKMDINIDTDRIISLFTDNLSPEEYKQFNTDKAEDFLINYANKLFKK